MQISISNTFKISVGEHEIILSRVDAEKLYQELGGALGKNTTPTTLSTPTTLFRGSPTGPSDFFPPFNLTGNKP